MKIYQYQYQYSPSEIIWTSVCRGVLRIVRASLGILIPRVFNILNNSFNASCRIWNDSAQVLIFQMASIVFSNSTFELSIWISWVSRITSCSTHDTTFSLVSVKTDLWTAVNDESKARLLYLLHNSTNSNLFSHLFWYWHFIFENILIKRYRQFNQMNLQNHEI